MDEGGSPWSDVPSRSHSSQNLAKDEETAEASSTNPAPTSPPSSTVAPATSQAVVPDAKPAPSKSRRPGRHVALTQSTVLESLDDDSMGPLGPLGAAPVEESNVPAPPTKELTSRAKPAASRPGTTASGASVDEYAGASPNGTRQPPPVLPPQFADRTKPAQPSVSIEQAAKPIFNIAVGDPHKVGNAASSHTVYSVMTKTTSKAYLNPSFTVKRRYKDFLWLYEQLHSNNPGIVVPPPPEKQAVGRFDADFIESRRMALERMINKAAAHPILQQDGDLKTFLESEAFNVDIKYRDRKDPLLGGSESKGMFGGFGISVGGSSKFIEHDDWFHDRRIYLDALENQLKALQKSVDTVIAQRRGLADSCADFAASLHSLAAVELSPSLSGPLDALGDLQLRIQELYSRQAMQDILTLGIVIDEYIRMVGSVKKAFEQRQKAYHACHSADSKLVDIKKQQEKLLRAGRSQQDRIQQMAADVADQERRCNASRVLFDDMGRLMRSELERFEREKVEDFKSGVETFLESAIEAQKELIELWETYLLQLDSDEDGPPLMPAGIRAENDGQTSTTSTTAGPSTQPPESTKGIDDDHTESATLVGTEENPNDDRASTASAAAVAAAEAIANDDGGFGASSGQDDTQPHHASQDGSEG
ncbi:vacuolar protein sorting-associated protein Vps5 [Polychaeton citri CBS 116435]|uniref:Vacuolar protein sorting-associated protein Vps5 n=1 Tax=Polychaeton citri CBS 116435 TaxID=1314669 RepID=A0A9P4Q1M6_9PEZI|nr:vacuolar protein sorting-associated protein Vps5 [Polychaeton citri CBS 116435]